MSEQHVPELLRRWFAANEPDSRAIPGFKLTLDAARRRLETQTVTPTRWFLSGWVAVAASVAAIGIATVLAQRTRSPSLQDDIRLAQSLSFESVWRSPSDSLLAQSTPTLLRETPAMPRTGEPQFGTPIAKEYL